MHVTFADGPPKRSPTWKVKPGVCYESLAFEVARREGLPESFLARSEELYQSIISESSPTRLNTSSGYDQAWRDRTPTGQQSDFEYGGSDSSGQIMSSASQEPGSDVSNSGSQAHGPQDVQVASELVSMSKTSNVVRAQSHTSKAVIDISLC